MPERCECHDCTMARAEERAATHCMICGYRPASLRIPSYQGAQATIRVCETCKERWDWDKAGNAAEESASQAHAPAAAPARVSVTTPHAHVFNDTHRALGGARACLRCGIVEEAAAWQAAQEHRAQEAGSHTLCPACGMIKREGHTCKTTPTREEYEAMVHSMYDPTAEQATSQAQGSPAPPAKGQARTWVGGVGWVSTYDG